MCEQHGMKVMTVGLRVLCLEYANTMTVVPIMTSSQHTTFIFSPDACFSEDWGSIILECICRVFADLLTKNNVQGIN